MSGVGDYKFGRQLGLVKCHTLRQYLVLRCSSRDDCVLVAVSNSVISELDREKLLRLEAENKVKELEATDAQHQQNMHDLEAQIRDLQAAKVNKVK